MSNEDLKKGLFRTPIQEETPEPETQRAEDELAEALELYNQGERRKSIPVLEKYARLEFPEAEYVFGTYCMSGRDSTDAEKAQYYLKKAAEHGSADAWYKLFCSMPSKSSNEALEYLHKGMDKGSDNCVRELRSRLSSLPQKKQKEVLTKYLALKLGEYERYEAFKDLGMLKKKKRGYYSSLGFMVTDATWGIRRVIRNAAANLWELLAKLRKVVIPIACIVFVTMRYNKHCTDFLEGELNVFLHMLYTGLLFFLTTLVGCFLSSSDAAEHLGTYIFGAYVLYGMAFFVLGFIFGDGIVVPMFCIFNIVLMCATAFDFLE